MTSLNPLKSANSRVFLIEGGADPANVPSYEDCFKLMGVSQGFGDTERIENPDPNQYGSFVEVGYVVGATERPTSSIQGRFPQDTLSKLLRIAKKKCSVDIQLHLGACKDPRTFTAFDKAIILEDARLTNFETDDLGALESGENAVVNQTSEISAKELYEVVPVSYGVKAASLVTNEVVDAVICDTPACGDCDDETDGCEKIFSVTKSAGGSPSTPSDVVFSIDKGVNWYAHDVDTLGAAEDAMAISCLGLYVVVISNASGSAHYALKSEFTAVDDPSFTEVATGFVAGGEPNDMWMVDGQLFIVGDNGYIYKTEDITAGVSVLDAGSATSATLQAVHAISREVAVAVGENGSVVYTHNGSTWTLPAASPVGYATNLTCVWVVSKSIWWVGDNTGRLWYTKDTGNTWTEKAFPGSGTGVVYDICFSTKSVGWLAHATTAPLGRILRTYDGGNQWIVTPEGASSLALNDRVTALAACSFDANFVVGVGLADDGSDGFVSVGQGA